MQSASNVYSAVGEKLDTIHTVRIYDQQALTCCIHLNLLFQIGMGKPGILGGHLRLIFLATENSA